MDQRPPLTTRPVFTVKAMIDPAVVVGPSDKGMRQFIPLTGGTIEGDGIKGEVIPGGADWQLIRADGVVEIEAIYAIRLEDGTVINVRNCGIAVVNEKERYVRTSPSFQAPEGPYDWLNKRMFVAVITASPDGDYVTVNVFELE